eukprot:2571613-Amphidinium_carterae.2
MLNPDLAKAYLNQEVTNQHERVHNLCKIRRGLENLTFQSALGQIDSAVRDLMLRHRTPVSQPS